MRFSRHEKAATAIIAVTICAVTLITRVVDSTESEVARPSKKSIAEIEAFAVTATDTVIRKYYSPPPPKPVLFRFNPNTADSIQLVRLGLSKFVARNIIRYRKAGGVFRKPTDVRRIYGLTAEEYRRIFPYIDIPEETATCSIYMDTLRVSNKLRKGERVDINCGDTLLLKRIPGVGSTLAWRIVRYGERLGGYIAAEQVAEVYGVSPETVEWCRVENVSPQKINLNTATFAVMIRHPYLSKPQVQAILRHRDAVGRLSDLLQMRFDTAFTDRDMQRLLPYVEF